MAGAHTTGQAFLYNAFISYRHVDRDRQWAAWLINALERYRIPRALQKKGFPARLRKIFRDEDRDSRFLGFERSNQAGACSFA